MSEGYREHTQNDSDDDVESPDGTTADKDTLEFVWEGILEEMGRYENFDVDMKFTRQEWMSLSQPLQGFILAQRLLNIPQATKNPGSEVSNLDMDAKRSSDVNVTVRSRSVESGNEEIGSSMQRIASNLMQDNNPDSRMDCPSNVRQAETLEDPDNNPDSRKDCPGDFEDLMEMVVLKKDFKNSMDTISQRLEQIPLDLDAHEVVLKNEFAITGDNLRHDIVEEVGTVLRTALTGTVTAPSLGQRG